MEQRIITSTLAPITGTVRITTPKGVLEFTKIGTTNKGKLSEFQSVGLQLIPQACEAREVEANDKERTLISEGKFVEVSDRLALIKAKLVARKLKEPILIENSSLWLLGKGLEYIVGPNIKNFLHKDKDGDYSGLKYLIGLCSLAGDSRALFVSTLAVSDGNNRSIAWSGVIEGHISDRVRGDKGFGFDPIFMPEPVRQLTTIFPENENVLTLAEMAPEIRYKHFSARFRAVEKLRAALI